MKCDLCGETFAITDVHHCEREIKVSMKLMAQIRRVAIDITAAIDDGYYDDAREGAVQITQLIPSNQD